jgi:hypothetical protein
MRHWIELARQNSERILALAIFVATLALYVRTAAPTLGGAFDSEEFQHVAYTLGIAHSTGYPLYLLMGKLFTTLGPIGNIAYRMNLLSALIGAATASIVYLNVSILTRSQLASIATVALFITNPAVWRQAGVASVGPLHLLLLASIMYAVLLWHEKRASIAPVAFLFGLGLAHHRTTIWLGIPIALLILIQAPDTFKRPRELFKNFCWLILPLALYLYMPVFGNNSPWYSNTWQGFVQQISGSDAGNFIRDTPLEMLEGISLVSQYLLSSFSYIGLAFILGGAIFSRWRARPSMMLFLGVATLVFYIQGAFYAGEPDRYLVLPFVFLVYWFALGVSLLENLIINHSQFVIRNFPLRFILHPSLLKIILVVILVLLVVLPFPTHFRYADWSTFDRTYKQWDEIFTLPIPLNATIVGNWGQLNAMRYLQRVEQRRIDIQAIGTLYDTAPQTIAAQNAFADGRAIFLAPGVALPTGEYRYAQLGPLLEVRDKPQMNPPPKSPKFYIGWNTTLTLADYSVTTALEPYAPTASIAPNRTVRVSLNWRAESNVKDFLVRLKLYDPENRIIAQKDEPPVRGLYPATQWTRGEYVSDVHNFLIPAGSPPGMYALKMQTLDAETKKLTSDEIALASFAVERATNLARESVFTARPIDITIDNRLALWGHSGLDGAQRVGEILRLNLVWFAQENIGEDLTLHFRLSDSVGKIAGEWKRAPIEFYPTSQWRKGEILKAYYDLQLANALPPDEYTLAITIGQKTFSIGKIQIAP